MTLRERARDALIVLISHPNHYLMWGASAALTIIFFVEVAAGSAVYQAIFSVVGYSFDYTKDRVWRRSIIEEHRGMKNLYRFVACGFASFSLLSTGLAGLTIAEKFSPPSKRVDSSAEVAELKNTISDNKADIEELTASRDALGEEYATAKIKYNTAIQELKMKNLDLTVRISELQAGAERPVVNSAKRMFELVSERLNVGISSVVFWFFMFFGWWLEVGNFATAPELDDLRARNSPAAPRVSAPTAPPAPDPARPAPRPAPRPSPRPAPPPAPEPARPTVLAPVPKPEPTLSEKLLETPVAARKPAPPPHPDLFGDSQ